MPASGSKSLAVLGFLTVVDRGAEGLFGGYLLLNEHGRPLEFHCTAPVLPNRAQEILYGRTLKPYLYGEQIGQTLLDSAKAKPLWVCVDSAATLAARDFAACPLVLIGDADAAFDSADAAPRLAAAIRSSNSARENLTGLVRFPLGRHEAAARYDYAADKEQVIQHWRENFAELDLAEPFGRIREAIEEARRGAA